MRSARLKIAVLAPMRIARVATATAVKLGDLRSPRKPKATSFSKPSISAVLLERCQAIWRPGFLHLSPRLSTRKCVFWSESRKESVHRWNVLSDPEQAQPFREHRSSGRIQTGYAPDKGRTHTGRRSSLAPNTGPNAQRGMVSSFVAR